MIETPRAYADRISSYVRGKDHLRVLRSTPALVERLLRGKKASSLKKHPAGGRWSIAAILAHLAESELVFGYRLRLIVGANGTPIQAFDQNIWQSNAAGLRARPLQALELFSVLRRANISFLNSLTPEQWKSYGLHAERGEESIGRMVELYAGHDVNHVRQIRDIARQDRGTTNNVKRRKPRKR